MTAALRPHARHKAPKGPVVLVVMDGIGRGAGDEADAVAIASTPTMDRLWVPGVRAELRAHGKAVGLPSDDDMGNSEVGHNALGAGKVYAQGAVLVGRAIASRSLFEGETWRAIVARGARGGAVHFLGLLSDGNVHSHLDHLEALLGEAARAGCKKLYVHALLDGRDVAPTSALTYVDRIEAFLGTLRDAGCDARIASGGGRMHITMDRYEADWPMVERGWNTHVLADARAFPSAKRRDRDAARRAPRRHRPGSAGVRGQPGGADAGRRCVRDVQLPRRPRDRDLARLR